MGRDERLNLQNSPFGKPRPMAGSNIPIVGQSTPQPADIRGRDLQIGDEILCDFPFMGWRILDMKKIHPNGIVDVVVGQMLHLQFAPGPNFEICRIRTAQEAGPLPITMKGKDEAPGTADPPQQGGTLKELRDDAMGDPQ